MESTSFEQACVNRGYDPETVLPDLSNYPEKHRNALMAAAKLFIVTEDINDGEDPDWNDNNEQKWENWFDMEVDENNPSGFRFDGAYFANSYSNVGSRLCFRGREKARHAAKYFIDLYRDLFVINK